MKVDPQLRALLLKHPAHFFSFGFGSGLSPKAPGTCGSLVAIPLVWCFWFLPLSIAIVVALVVVVFGVWCTDYTAKVIDTDDPGAIVWDEIAGMCVAALPLNYYGIQHFSIAYNIGFLVFIFVVFRIFDIMKPFPVSWADQNCHGGLGIMLDDVFAGGLAGIAFVLLLFFVTF